MKKIYTEIGFGNGSLLSTEIEGEDSEVRVKRFIIPKKITGVYFRFWVFKRVLIISLFGGLTIKKKNRNNLKLLFGIEGIA